MTTKKRKQGKRKPRWLPRLPPTVNAKQVVIGLLPYILIAWVGDKLGWLYRCCPGNNLLSRLVVLLSNAQMAFGQPFISFHPRDLLVGVAAAAAVRLVVAYRAGNSKKFRHGREYGSARWGTPKDIAPFIDPVYENNIILTATERLTMNGRPYLPKYARNKNVIVIGGSGSGKTRFYVKPNLMQMPEKVSFVVTDPKGSLIIECGRMLVKGGYRVKVLNTINFAKSMHYNPFQYIRSEKDILKLVNALIANTKGDGEKAGEDFWVKSERLLFSALIGYLWYEAPEDEQNFTMLLELINAFEVREEDETFKNAIDLLFDDLARDKPDHFAVRQYAKFKLAAGKTAKSILISCGARLAPFDIAELRDLLAYDEMELDMIGDQRTALFIIVSDTDSTFNFVVAMMYSQLFNLLCDRADDVHGGRLPYHVRFLLDEFANIGQIPMFDKLIATIRSREMSANIILQSQSQLKTIYKDAAETIIGNCDTMLFLGGKEPSTLKEISETLGKETIDLYNTSDTRGQSRSMGLNYQKTGHELMSRDELAVMDGNKCILVHGGGTTVISTTYVSTDEDIYAAENAYCALEEGLNAQIYSLPSTHPGYDDYEYQIDEIEHNPYHLISYLQVKFGGFTYNNEVKAEINRLFRQQYSLSLSTGSEMRIRVETVMETREVYDEETGLTVIEEYPVEQEVEYEHRTQYAVLTNHYFDMVARANMNEEEAIIYDALNKTYGNRPYLFDLSAASGVGSSGIHFDIPPEALSDVKFANMIREAEKYLGMPYVWGGKSPRTGFDCSGFVCWVLNHCGNGWNVGTKRAKELCRMCTYVSPDQARPGDLVFFEKTYDTDGASHVGIYVGQNTMIHCGNPIKYGRIDTRYFKAHFLCFGRLPFYDD